MQYLNCLENDGEKLLSSLVIGGREEVCNENERQALLLRVQSLLERDGFAGFYGRLGRLSLRLLINLARRGRLREDGSLYAELSLKEESRELLESLLQHAANESECSLEVLLDGTLSRFSPLEDWEDPLTGRNPAPYIEEMLALAASSRHPYVASCLLLLSGIAMKSALLRGGQLALFIPQIAAAPPLNSMLERAVSEIGASRAEGGEEFPSIVLCHLITNTALGNIRALHAYS